MHAWHEQQLREEFPNLSDDMAPEEIIMTVRYLLHDVPIYKQRILNMHAGIGQPRMATQDIARQLEVPVSEIETIIRETKREMLDKLEHTKRWVEGLDERVEAIKLN